MSQTKFKGKQIADGPTEGDVPTIKSDNKTYEHKAAGAAAVAGADTQVQFNDGGVMGADAGMVYSKGGAALLITGVITSTTGSIRVPQGDITAGTSIEATTFMQAGTHVTAVAHMNAGTYIEATTYSEAGTDFRLVSQTANSGGGLKQTYSEATSGALSGPTGTIPVNIPQGAKLIGVQLRVDTLVTGDGIFNGFSAAYSGGAAQVITVAFNPAKNTKVSKFFDENADTAITFGGVTNITLTGIGGNFTAGVVRAIVYYEDFIEMDDNP